MKDAVKKNAPARARREYRGAREVLTEAQKLLELNFWGAAISRGYYAIFHAARALLYEKNSNPTTHKGVVSEFSRLYVKTNKVDQIHLRMLRHAREERQVVDYESFEKDILPTEKLAHEIVAAAASLSKWPVSC